MKKILLSVIALFTATIVSAQSLSLVIRDYETKDDVAVLNSGDTYNVGSLWNEELEADTELYFYIKNKSDKSGTVTFESWEKISGNFDGLSLCYAGEDGGMGECHAWVGKLGPFDIPANGVLDRDMDFMFISMDPNVPGGNSEVKLNIKFSEDAEPCVFNIKVKLGDPSSINSVASNESNVKFYQNGNNVTMDYAFNEGGNRTLSIVSLSGNVLYTCELEGSNGTLNVPVELASGVYLYTVNGENGTTAHKFVVR